MALGESVAAVAGQFVLGLGSGKIVSDRSVPSVRMAVILIDLMPIFCAGLLMFFTVRMKSFAFPPSTKVSGLAAALNSIWFSRAEEPNRQTCRRGSKNHHPCDYGRSAEGCDKFSSFKHARLPFSERLGAVSCSEPWRVYSLDVERFGPQTYPLSGLDPSVRFESITVFRNFSSSVRPCVLHSFVFQRLPSLMASA